MRRRLGRRHLPDRVIDVVLGTLDAGGKGALAAGDDEAQPRCRPGEGRRQLGAILHGHPTGGAGADIDQAAAVAKRAIGGFRRRRHRGQRVADSGNGRELALPHRLHGGGKRPGIEIGKAGVDFFRGHARSAPSEDD